MTRHDGSGDRWFDRDAGPVVRPYALTKGRTLPSGGESFDLIDVVVATSDRMPENFRPGPEHRRLLSLCRRPTPIVDLTSEIDLPLGVVRVLLGDLISEGLVRVLSTQKQPATDQRLLRMVLDGLESL
ncbi:MAG: DUF742 domain-containing protein [Streptosporangiaceae bacterium]